MDIWLKMIMDHIPTLTVFFYLQCPWRRLQVKENSQGTCSAPGGDFQSILDEDMVPFECDIQHYLRQILEALQFIHDKNIAHLDIKVSTQLCFI